MSPFANRDVILRQNWIVLPKIYQNLAIQLAHQGNMGIINTKSLLQSKVYFPQMDNKVEELRRTFSVKQYTLKSNP